MENNQENKLSDFEEDFKDFEDDGQNAAPALDEDISGVDIELAQENIQKELEKMQDIKEEDSEPNLQEKETQEPEQEEQDELPSNTPQDEQEPQKKEESSIWDEFDAENSAVKKYIFYVSRDFVPYIDNLSADERSAYINDAIQKKIESENEDKKREIKRKITLHFIVMILTFILLSPFVLWLSHKAIMATFDNYKYSQENFEKLYKQRFEKDRAYMRSIQYNKEQQAKIKKQIN